MLRELRVRQLGVIDDLTIELGPGMTALTGETGAGKTLVVDALALALGQRADPSMVRSGATEALVEARFTDGAADELIVARAVPAAGRSRCWVDGRMAPLSVLVEAAEQEADIHGQGDHHALARGPMQRRVLDAFGHIDSAPVDDLRHRLRTLDRRFEGLGGDLHQRARELDILTHQITEIDSVGLDDPNEDADLGAEEDRLGDIAALRQAAATALEALDSDGTTLDLVGLAATALDGRAALLQLDQRLRSVQAEVADIASELRAVLDNWDEDPSRLARVQTRRRQLSELYRKYGGDRAATLAFAQTAVERHQALRLDEEQATVLEAERAQLASSLAAAERALLAARTAAAPALAVAVEHRLEDLALASSRFAVEVEETGAGEHVSFLFAANPGEELRPLAKAASGGELARVMLALRLSAPGGPPTMVFDEVDAGVGGSAALALAQALREVSRDRQVLVVTHLAQVAALADDQISVAKVETQGRVVTTARALPPADRVVEISRMLSGHPDSARARAHAEELLALRVDEMAKNSPEPSTMGAPARH